MFTLITLETQIKPPVVIVRHINAIETHYYLMWVFFILTHYISSIKTSVGICAVEDGELSTSKIVGKERSSLGRLGATLNGGIMGCNEGIILYNSFILK